MNAGSRNEYMGRMDEEEEEEEDYMNMDFAAEAAKPESSLQRSMRKKREGEIKGRVKSKAEREADAAARREAALATSIDETNVGFRMMKKLGYKPGSTLGQAADARRNPIELTMKEDKSGIGLDSQKKRKFREQWEEEAKRVKMDEGDYRERLRQEREDKRIGRLIPAAQKVCEQLDTDGTDQTEGRVEIGSSDQGESVRSSTESGSLQTLCHHRPLKAISVVWRGLIRQRLEEELRRRMHAGIHARTSLLPTYGTEDDDDAGIEAALPASEKLVEDHLVEEELEEDDPEFEAFVQLNPTEQLKSILEYLRRVHHYCFWCKQQYATEDMDGCPGLEEDDHD